MQVLFYRLRLHVGTAPHLQNINQPILTRFINLVPTAVTPTTTKYRRHSPRDYQTLLAVTMGSVVLPHLESGWHVDQAILSEDERLVVIRFGRDHDPDCMRQDEVLYKIAERVKNFAVIYVCDIDRVPDFNTMYELYDPCTVMFFFVSSYYLDFCLRLTFRASLVRYFCGNLLRISWYIITNVQFSLGSETNTSCAIWERVTTTNYPLF